MSTSRKEKEKENDPTLGRLKRLGSIASITTPIGQIASKFRRPSTSHHSTMSSSTQDGPKKPSFIPRSNRQSSKGSSESQLKTPPATPNMPAGSRSLAKDKTSRLPKSRTTSTLPLLSSREPFYKPLASSQSSTNLVKQSSMPMPHAARSYDNVNSSQKTRDFSALRKISGSALPRFSTQPNLFSTNVTKKHGSQSVYNRMGIDARSQEPHSIRPWPAEQPLRSKDDIAEATSGSSLEQVNETWRSRNIIQQTIWQQQTPTRKVAQCRKSIDEIYEELQCSPSNTTPKTARSESSARSSLGGTIQHHQLMSPLSPPLPPLPARFTQLQSPNSPLSASSVRQVTHAQPSGYWSGRFTSIHDRLMNDAVDANSKSSNPFLPDLPGQPSREEDELARLTGAAQGIAHAQRILDLLYSACVTAEAVESLRTWQATFGRLRQMPGLATYVPRALSATVSLRRADGDGDSMVLRPSSGNAHGGASGGSYDDAQQGNEFNEMSMLMSKTPGLTSPEVKLLSHSTRGRKTSFIDRLLGSGGKVSGKAKGFGKSGTLYF